MKTNSAAIVAEDLVKIYNPESEEIAVRAVDGVSFTVEQGESVAIIGPSGGGKSTLMHIIGCLDLPTSGRYLLGRQTAVENVELPMLYAGGSSARERALEALEQVGLSDRAHHLPNELSGGQKQRVAIARAVVTRPSVLLCDEPTGALDTRTGGEILDLLLRLNDRGSTVVVVTHDLDVAARLSRAIRLRDGKIETDGPAEELLESFARLSSPGGV